jgi:signal transduction histidine kinase
MKKQVIISGIILSVVFYLLLSSFSSLQNSIEKQTKDEFNREQRLITERIVFQLEDMFDGIRKGVLFLRHPFALLKLIDAIDSGDKKEIPFWRDGIEKVYIPFTSSHPFCDEITFADNNGNEIVKVIRDLSGYIGAVEESHLKKISGAPLFIEAIKLDYGNTYITRSENRIKVGTPVYHNLQKKGVVIVEMETDKAYSIIAPIKYGEKSHTMLFTDKGELLFCSQGLTEGQHRGEIEYILKNPEGGYTEIPESHGEKDILMASSSLKVGDERLVVAIEATSMEVTNRIKGFEKKRKEILIILAMVTIGGGVYFHKVRSDRISAEVKAREEEEALKKIKALNKQLEDSNHELELLNNELNMASERMKELDRMKTDFLNIVTHDIRTPLTSIRAYADMLIMYQDKPETLKKVYNEFLNIIKKESIRLGNLINDYLDLEKMESGGVTFRQEPVDMLSIINDTIVTHHGEAIEKGISLKSVILEKIPVIIGDDGKIRQVIANLLNNAIKFTPQGGEVKVSAAKDGDKLEIAVEDTGAGIPKEYHDKIFERFVQIEGKEKIKKGTGLGLPIVKNIIEHHGGRVWVESEEGKGAKFLFTLPIGAKT